jgi:membrane protein DedA with SNARE-associated domain
VASVVRIHSPPPPDTARETAPWLSFYIWLSLGLVGEGSAVVDYNCHIGIKCLQGLALNEYADICVNRHPRVYPHNAEKYEGNDEMNLDVHFWLAHYGYIGVFFILMSEVIGIPFPAETTLTLTGIAWSAGQLSLVPLVVMAALGNIVGSTIAYFVGKYLGRLVILRVGKYVGITEKRLDKAEMQFRKYQSGIIFVGKFIAGIRVLIPYLAGINETPFIRFTLYNAIAAVIWVVTFVLLGSYIGVLWKQYHGLVLHYMVPSIIILVVLVGLYVWWKVRSHRRKKLEDRAEGSDNHSQSM